MGQLRTTEKSGDQFWRYWQHRLAGHVQTWQTALISEPNRKGRPDRRAIHLNLDMAG